MKLNIGSGDKPIEGYESVDINGGIDARSLPYADNSCDEVYASHLLEHFRWDEIPSVLREWHRVLAPGGVLRVSVPDAEKVVSGYRTLPEDLSRLMMGGAIDENDRHGACFTRQSLTKYLQRIGFSGVSPFESFTDDCSSWPMSLNLQGTKRTPPVIRDKPKALICLSYPRLNMTENAFSIIETVIEMCATMGFTLMRGQGAFWERTLQRQLEEAASGDYDYALAIDFDSAFSPEHVRALFNIMQSRPDIDALFPVQAHRNKNAPLVYDQTLDYSGPLTECHAGHFGLTVIRTGPLREIPRPWLWSMPDPEGSWTSGKAQDADILFWRLMHDYGFKVAQANEVVVGHMELCVRWPCKQGIALQPLHMYRDDPMPGYAEFNPDAFREKSEA